MNAVELAAMRLVQDADQVDDHRCTPRQLHEHRFIMDVDFDDIDGRKQDQMLGALALPGRHDDSPPGSGQARNEVPADETAAAQHQRRRVIHRAHGASFGRSPAGIAATSLDAPLEPLGATTPRRSRSATYGSPSCA